MSDGQSQRATRLFDAGATLRLKLFWPSVVFVALFTLVVATGSNRLLEDPDTLWHVAVGRDIWASGSVPWVDKFSHTFQGHPWISPEWLSELLLWGAYERLGWKGVIILAAGASALTFALVFSNLARQWRVVPAIIATAFAFSLSIPHSGARPYLLSYPLMVVWVMSLVRAADARTFPSFLLLPVMVIWANVHGGFTLGLVIAGALAVEAVLASEATTRGLTARRWGLFLGAALLASFISPYGPYSLYNNYKTFGDNETLQMIYEWQPFSFGAQPILGKLLMLALFSSLYFGVRLPLVRCAIVVFLIYMTMVHMRFISVLAPTAVILMAGPLAQQFGYIRAGRAEELPKSVAWATRPVSLAAMALLAVAFLWRVFPSDPRPGPVSAPVGAVDYIEFHRQGAKVYNDYNFGGYLIFRGIPTFIDGRTAQLFLGGFMSNISRSLNGTKSEFLDLLDKYDVSLALVAPNSVAAHKLSEADTWHKSYADSAAVVYERSFRK